MIGENPHLTIEVTVAADSCTIVLAGEADLSGSPRIGAAFKGAQVDESRLVVLDLRNLTFIDSSGLHVLVTSYELCRARGQELHVIPGPPNVQRLFELAGMDDVLPFCEAPHSQVPSPPDGAGGPLSGDDE